MGRCKLIAKLVSFRLLQTLARAQDDVASSRRFPPRKSNSESVVLAFPQQGSGCSLQFDDVETESMETYEAGKTYRLTAVHHAKGQMLVGATAGTVEIDESLKMLKDSGGC